MDGPGPHTSLSPVRAAAVDTPPEEVTDEVCPDTMYASVDSNVRCGDGNTAF